MTTPTNLRLLIAAAVDDLFEEWAINASGSWPRRAIVDRLCAKLRADADAPSPLTVRVRIAVAVDDNGAWNAAGYKESDEETNVCIALDGLDSDQAQTVVHFVEANLPIPVAATIEGEVKS